MSIRRAQPTLIAVAASFLTIIWPATARAQTSATVPDSVVAAVADAQALPFLPIEQRPLVGTFWEIRASVRSIAAPLPFPPLDPTTPVYAVGSRQFIVDATAGALPVDPPLDAATAALELAAKLEEFIGKIRTNLALQEAGVAVNTGTLSTEQPPLPGEGGYGVGGEGGTTNTIYADTEFWLRITNVSLAGSFASFAVHGTTNTAVYGIQSREAWGVTNTWTDAAVPFLGSTGQDWSPAAVYFSNGIPEINFFRAVNYTGDPDADGLPNWWELKYGLDPNKAKSNGITSDGELDSDGDGYKNCEEYLLGQSPTVADPPRPIISISATDPSAAEPTSGGAVTITRSGSTARALTVYFKTEGLARSGSDFQCLGDHVTLASGQPSATVQIVPIDDAVYEGSEEVTVRLMPGLDYIPAATDFATVTIDDNELQPVKVEASSDPVLEGSGTNGVFRFYREGDTRSPLTVTFSLTGTATNGVTYQALPTSITFAAEAERTNLTLVPINNAVYSGETACTLALSSGSGYTPVLNAASATLTLQDDDLPAVSIVATDPDAREAGLNPGRFSVIRTGDTREPLTVYYRISGTAEIGSNNITGDYQALTNGAVIPTGQTNVFIDVVPIQDSLSEEMEQVIVTLAGDERYDIGASNRAAVNIDDDEPLSYACAITRPSIYETAWPYRPGIIEITRKGSALSASSLSWSVTDTNGVPLAQNTHYAIEGDLVSGSLYFAPNKSKAVVRLRHLVTSLAAMQFRFGDQVLTVPCWPKDRLVRLYADPDFSVEGELNNRARLHLVRPLNGPALTVKLRLEAHSAIPGTDFSTTNLQTVTFAANTSEAVADVFAFADGAAEGWENFAVRLDTSDLTYATFNPNVAMDSPRQETYAVVWIRESSTPPSRPDVDTDNDLLTDAFETAFGLDPLVPDDFQSDEDKDGLSLLEEQTAATNPGLADTDSDGVNDFHEVARGTSPTNALEHVPTNRTVAVKCVVGDDSGSLSELWQLRVGGFNLNNSAPGKVITRTISLEEGTSNRITLHHLGSILDPPDLDYHIEVQSGSSGPAAFFLSDPQHLLGAHFNPGDGPDYTNKTASILVPRLELTWTNKGDNLALDPHTNGISNEVRGMRIFVGAKTPTENLARNTVMLKIKTSPPLVGSNVWLRSFDVDDTTPESFDHEGVIDTTGRSGDDNFNDYLNTPKAGVFVTSGQQTNLATLDSRGEALVEFRVGMQPGNNYRIAATVFPTNNLNTLQVTNTAGAGFVPADADLDRGIFNGALSPLLTVWRKLHIEFDSMEAVPSSGPQANFRSASIAMVRTNAPAPGQSTVVLQPGLAAIDANELENGTVTISTSQLSIIGNYPRTSMIVGAFGALSVQNVLVLQGVAPVVPVNTICTFGDDDDRFLSTIGLPPALPKDGESTNVVQGVRPVFLPAFLEVVNANAESLNGRRRIAFRLNQTPGLAGGPFTDAKDVSDSSSFWAHTVVFGYQPETASDMDPATEGPAFGDTRKQGIFGNPGVSAIYVEMTREANDRVMERFRNDPAQYPGMRIDYYNWLYGITAHEAAHYPGRQSPDEDHAEDGLMHAEGQALKPFTPPTIKRFRRALSWSN